MTINSLSFIAFLAVTLVMFHLLPRGWRHRVIFPLSSLMFMILVMPSWAACVAVIGFAALIWLVTVLITKVPGRFSGVALICLVLLLFGWLKSYTFLSLLPFSAAVPATIGLSYMLIRGLQLIFDVRDNPALKPNPLTVFSFLISWPCLVSGPVQRFQEFEEQMNGMAEFRLSGGIVFNAIRRMVLGWFWVLVLGDISMHIWLDLKEIAFRNAHPMALGGAQFAFLIHLFFNFAGYTEIVIGAGSLFGLRLPENFDRPFQSRSFLEFWSRWHMSMSGWFKVYVFNPVLLQLTQRWPSPGASNWLGAAAFFVTFFLVGIWHGTTGSFVICGLLLGFGASVNQWHRSFFRKFLGKKKFTHLGGNPAYATFCTGITFSYLCLSIAPLWMSVDEMWIIISGHGYISIALAQLVVLVLATLLFSWRWRFPGFSEKQWLTCANIGLQCAIIEVYLFLYPAFSGAFFYEQF